jgi:hypothetical protein
MAQYIQLPSGKSFQLTEGENPQDGWFRALEKYPQEFGFSPSGKQPEGGFGAAFSAGLSRLAGETGLTAGKAGIVDLATAEEYYRQQQEKAARIFKPTEKGWTEDPIQKLKEVAGGSAAYMLAPAAAGVAGLFAPVSVPVIGAAGALAGLTSLGQFTGSNIAAQMEEGKTLAETSGALAAATALPQAALDVLSFRMMPGIKAIFGATGKEITEAQAKALAEQTLKQKIGDYAAATGVSMGVEGATEVVQDFLEKAQAGAQLTDEKARADYLESLIGGAALAGVLGPFGRGFERRGIAAKGKELETERLAAEAAAKEKERLAALEEERAFKLTPPEGLIGPEAPAELQQQRLQARLAQIEQEVQVARQAQDIDKLLQLQRERTALEAQVEEEVSPFDKRRDLEKRISALESLEVKLQERADAATLAGRQPILASLASVQEQLRVARSELEAGEKSGALPKIEKSDASLLKREKAAINALLAARETGSGAAQALAAGRLNQIEEQLGLFGMESFAEKERFEAEQRRREEEAEAARLAAQKPLLLPDQRGTTPIEMGVNTELFPTVPYKPGPYTQETLFGPPERVLTPSQTEMTLPQIQSTVAQLKERANLSPQDQMMLARLRQKENLTRIERALLTTLEQKMALSPEDQALLERIENVAVPAPGVNIPEALQTRLTALQGVRQRIEQQLLQRGERALQEEERAVSAEPIKPGEANTKARSGEFTLHDPADISVLKETKPIKVALSIDPATGNARVVGNGKEIDVTDMVKSGMTSEQIIARALGEDRSGKNVTAVGEKPAEAVPVKKETKAETQPANTLPAPNAFRYTVLEEPAYEGVEALSREDAEFELEVLLREAERGRLTPEWFSRSVIGRMLDTAQLMEVNSNIRQDPVAAVQGLIAAIKPAEAKPAEAKPAEAKPAEAEAKPEPKATYKYMRDEYGNLVPILVESKKKAAPVAETAAETETEAEAETEVEEEEQLSDAAKLKLLRQKVKVSPRVLSLDPSERSEADLTERLQQRLRQNSTLSSLFNRLDRLDQIEKELTEKLRGADRKAGTLLEKLTGRDEQNVTLRQRISDWLSDTAQGRGNEESRRALEEALLLVEQGQRGEKQPLTTLKRRIATQEESKLLGGKKTVSERVETGSDITAQQPELFADTEAASAVEFKTPEEMQAFMASEKLQKERAKQGEQALREAQEAGPPRPDELKKAQRLLRPTVAYLKKQIVGLKNVIKRLTGRVDNYNTLLQVRTEDQEDALIKAKKQLADVILAISKSLVDQHQKYALAKLELDNAQKVYAGLIDFKLSVEEAMGQALDRASAFAGQQEALKAKIEKGLAEKQKAFSTAFEKALRLREGITEVDLSEAIDRYVSRVPTRGAAQKMTEAVDPYLELWPAYNRALKEAQDAFKAIQDSIEENIGRPLTRPETAVVLDEEISNFLEQDATLTEMLIGQRRVVYNYERQVAEAQAALDSARQDQEKDPVWSAFLKEAEAAIQAATDISKTSPLTEPVALKKAIVAANKQINYLRAQQRDRSIQEQIRQLEEEKDKVTRRIKASEDTPYLTELNLGLSADALKLLNRKLIAARFTPLTWAEAQVLEEKTTLTKAEADALEDFKKQQQKRREELDRNLFTEEERTALENKTTTLQEIADNRRARIASIDQQINALRKELTTTTLRGERQAKAAQERAEKQAKTQADIRAENERLQRAAASALQVSGLTPEQREAVAKVQEDIESLLEAKAKAIEAKQKQTSHFQLSDELKKDVAAKQKAVRAEVAKKLKAEKDENKKTAIREQAAKDIAKIEADAREVQRAADIQKIEAAFKPQIEKAIAKARQLREAVPKKVSQREAAEEVEAIAETQRQQRTGPVVRNVLTGRVSEPGKAPSTRDLTEAQQAVEQAEANRIAAENADEVEESYLRGLLAYAKNVLGLDLSSFGLDTVPIEYAILEEQARLEEDAALRRGAEAKERANLKTAQEAAGALEFSLGVASQGGQTVTELENALGRVTGDKGLFRQRRAAAKQKTLEGQRQRIVILQSVADMRDYFDYEGAKIPSNTKAFVNPKNGDVFMFADNIGKGEELGILLHEVGVHLGFRNLFNAKQYTALVNAVKAWAKKNDGSVESRVAKKALARVKAAQTTAEQFDDELLAYTVEEAVAAGIRPDALSKTGAPLRNWLRMVLDTLKRALLPYGIDEKKLTVGDLVNMAYGAAQLELRGTWHGTDATFTAFDTSYAGTGEGVAAPQFEEGLGSLGAGPYTTAQKAYAEAYQKSVPFGKAANASGYGDKSYRDYRGMDKEFVSTSLEELPFSKIQAFYESKLLSAYLSGVADNDALDPTENKRAQKFIDTTREQLSSRLTQAEATLASRKKRKLETEEASATVDKLRTKLKAVNALDVSKIKGLTEKPAKGNLYRTLDDIPRSRVYEVNSVHTVGERPAIDALLQKYGSAIDKRDAEEDGRYFGNGFFYRMREKLGIEKTVELLKAAGIDAIEQLNERGRYVERAYIDYAPEILGVNLEPVGAATGKGLPGTGTLLFSKDPTRIDRLNPVTAELFHGSPNADLTSLQDFSFFTPNQKVAEQYAKKQVAFTGSTTDTGGKVYSVSVSTNNTLDLRIPEHRAAYQETRAKWNKQNPDPEDQLPSLGSEGFVMSTTGLPGYGRIAAVLRAMPEFDSAYVDEGSQGVSLVVKKGSAAQILNRQERLASIARGVFPGTATKYSSAVPKEVQDMVNRTIARTATLGDKITANATGLRMRTFIADSWAPVEALLKMGVAKDKIKEAQALQMRVYMRLFSNQQEYTNAALLNGVPELKTDADGVRNIEGGDARANAQTIAAALSKASKLGNQQAVERLFTMWMASLRAKQDGVSFAKLNFKNPPTAVELTALEQMLKDNKDVKDAFEEARRLYKEHNKRLLNLQVQTGAMSKEVADELGKGDYVGYYRVNDNGVVELMMGGSRPMRIGSVVDQPYLKELVGGEQHILPFFSSMVQNTSMLMTIALRNVQNDATANMFKKMELGEIIKVDEGSKAPVGKIHFKRDGDEYWFNADADAFEAAGIPADLMMQGLQGVKTTIPGLVRALAVPANFLRKAVRRLPTYTLRQTIRDPMHAWMITGGKFTPVLSTWKELYKGMTNTSQTQMTLKEAAIVGNNVYSGDTEGVADMLRQLSGNQSQFAKRMMQLDELAMKGEAATRAVLYDTFRQKGMGHVEALLNTAETMNFGRRGTSASLQWLSMLTPFFNAQIQGLDSVYRSLKGDNTFEQKMNARNMLLKRGALLAASTMMYALMMEDDETYKNATPAERYGNWFVRVPGTEATIRVPIPFELGLIFKSMPEAFVNTAFGDTKAKEAIKALAKQAYMSSPFGIPTAVKGPLEIAFNYNMFSDQPVETSRERAMDTDQRYRESTTEVAKLLGKFGVLSPVQIDHLVRSYMSSTGIALLSMANFALRPLTTREGVEKPDWVLEEVPVIGPLFQPKTGRGMVNAAFEDMMRIERAAQTYKTLAGSDPEAARAYADDYAKQISLAPLGGQFRQQMGEFAKYKRMVAMNPSLTAAEKREQIEKIKQQEIQYSTMLRKIAA